MMNEMNIKKMEQLLADEEFAQKIADAGSYEKAYELFAENGVDASYDEYMAYIEECHKDMVENGLLTEDGEMSAELLDMVSGGGVGQIGRKAAGAVFYICGQAFIATGDRRFVKVGVRLVAIGKCLWNS